MPTCPSIASASPGARTARGTSSSGSGGSSPTASWTSAATAALRDLLPRVRYTGIDLGGTPDITIDLERADRLPFDAAAFRCVVCSDVLEHLDNLHAVFGELLRVAGRLPESCEVDLRLRQRR